MAAAQTKSIPYFSQVVSPKLVKAMVTGARHPASDPRWAESGAESKEEYGQWALHICGITCLKMLLAARGINMTLFEILKLSIPYGTYIVDGLNIKGLIYRPCVSFLKTEFGIESEVKENYPAESLMADMAAHPEWLFIASVHSSIRYPKGTPPARGGHLILLYNSNPKEQLFHFHNPSGTVPQNQRNVPCHIDVFKKFYAERGILITKP